mmetsp:Transcript_71066/g.188948  ORF Transcript_71066/g.188948 Transcript_71066/m.188948 type:complete len:127 (-) Transcript_71066:89-469(-)|eukprot:CAMPEP_0171239186 /NCGR_PEP_ID=MMETSP0790-20130122/43849_1 /TAXON_ID=2925 /ORGANISM="Alexandrium catenella, Strain OF101" /LENGTH=126 /DNA_ID=CAMNT_0011705555 /DNA_START=51 /DNA_END=431 /DNA_ORIENTATION=-
MPRKLLRGFRKTKMLEPGESEEVTFAFSERDLSTRDAGAWRLWKGIVARFGASSEDLRGDLVLPFSGAEKTAAGLAALGAVKPAAVQPAATPKPPLQAPRFQAGRTFAEVGKKHANLRKALVAKHS